MCFLKPKVYYTPQDFTEISPTCVCVLLPALQQNTFASLSPIGAMLLCWWAMPGAESSPGPVSDGNVGAQSVQTPSQSTSSSSDTDTEYSSGSQV